MDDPILVYPVEQESRLPKEYWACPLCIVTLMEAHATGKVHHSEAFEALRNSGLVEDWRDKQGFVVTTERGRMFIEMILSTPLPVQKWIDPRTNQPTTQTSANFTTAQNVENFDKESE